MMWIPPEVSLELLEEEVSSPRDMGRGPIVGSTRPASLEALADAGISAVALKRMPNGRKSS